MFTPKAILLSALLGASVCSAAENTADSTVQKTCCRHMADNSVENHNKQQKASRLTVGGYGEAVMSRNFYSDSYLRYTDAESKRNAKSHGRFDLPHVVLYVGYDFGKGWTMGSEIEFEHGAH